MLSLIAAMRFSLRCCIDSSSSNTLLLAGSCCLLNSFLNRLFTTISSVTVNKLTNGLASCPITIRSINVCKIASLKHSSLTLGLIDICVVT